MTYGQWHEIFTQKVREYSERACSYALADCHNTLRARPDLSTDDPYYIKTWAEIDAIRERQLALTKGA